MSRARAELAAEIERLCNDLDRAADEGRDCSDQNYAIAWCVAEQHRDTILAALRGPSADDAYAERNKLVAALARLYPSGTKRTAIEGWDPEWEGCVYIDLPTGQASWHYHNREAELFADLPPYAGEWDGHSTEEKYRRLSALREPEHPCERCDGRGEGSHPMPDGSWQTDPCPECGGTGRVPLPGPEPDEAALPWPGSIAELSQKAACWKALADGGELTAQAAMRQIVADIETLLRAREG